MNRSIFIPPALSRQQVRQVDSTAIQEYGLSGLVLMENAGRGAAEAIDRLSETGNMAILCGKGNNGGDGYVIARHLQLLGHDVRIASVVPLNQLDGDALANAKVAMRSGFDVAVPRSRQDWDAWLSDAVVIVDCLLGTGAKGPPRDPYGDPIQASMHAGGVTLRVAIDIPSGLDCDTGQHWDPVFIADHTLTFVASKKGFDQSDAATITGNVEVIAIGVPLALLEQLPLQ
ncbi:MAG: NAD(P)H-hydrate epimerase [Planctomycetota bacterium]